MLFESLVHAGGASAAGTIAGVGCKHNLLPRAAHDLLLAKQLEVGNAVLVGAVLTHTAALCV